MTVEALLDSIRQLHQDVLGQLLIGCYVHGSLALGCFQWNRSDIDFLTLVPVSYTHLDVYKRQGWNH